MSAPDPSLRTTPRRRWFRISLRGLMVLVLIVGGGLGWEINRVRTQRDAIAAVRAAGGFLSFDYDQPPTKPLAPAWLRRWLGDDVFRNVQTVYFNDPVSPSILSSVAHFNHLKFFGLHEADGSGGGPLHIEGLRELNDLTLEGAWVDDAILAEIARIPSIQSLKLLRLSATDAGFAQLGSLPRLKNLGVIECPKLTDSGAAGMLEGMPQLRNLTLRGERPLVLRRSLESLAHHHPDLEQLSLAFPVLEVDDLAVIGRMGKLKFLSLGSSGITNAGWASLKTLPDLKRLLER